MIPSITDQYPKLKAVLDELKPKEAILREHKPPGQPIDYTYISQQVNDRHKKQGVI